MKTLNGEERSFFDERVGLHFIEAAKKTIESFFGEAPSMFEFKLTQKLDADLAVGASMRFESHDVEASMVLAVRREFAFDLYEQMLGERPTELTSDVDDCISELANIVYGMAKAPLGAEGFKFPMSRPQATHDVGALLQDQKCLSLMFRIRQDTTKEFALIFVVHRFESGAKGDAA